MVLMFGIGFMLSLASVPNEAFANHLSKNLKWQLVFISSEPGCGNYHYQIMNKYHDLAGAYINEYAIENEYYSPKCIPQVKYPQNYEKPNDLDLFVLVYDKNLGEEILQSNDIGGLYKHFGLDRTTNHFIVFCDCPNYDFSDPSWVLTHELSHFSLFYLGYDASIIEELVHENDRAFDQCRAEWTDNCTSVIQKLQATEYGYHQTVMPVYKHAIEGNKTNNPTPIISDDMVELSKLITQWWANEEPIDNKDYAKAIQLLGSSNDFYKDNLNVEFADAPINDETTWDEMLYGESEFDSNDIVSYVPFHIQSEAELDEIIDKKLSNLPSWFKQTAFWWASEKISDDEFVHSINYLKESGQIDPYFDLRFLISN